MFEKIGQMNGPETLQTVDGMELIDGPVFDSNAVKNAGHAREAAIPRRLLLNMRHYREHAQSKEVSTKNI